MTYPAAPTETGPGRVRVDSGQFWAGGAATAVVAALIALVGILISRWTFHIPILAPAGDGAWGDAHTGEYVLVAACVALIASGLLYLLILGAPAPGLFFRWIMGLATVAAVIYPFSTSAPLNQKGATAVVDLVLGVAITSLLTAVAARAIRRVVVTSQAGPVPPSQVTQRQVTGRQVTRPAAAPSYTPREDAGYVPGQRGDYPTQPVNVPPQDPDERWR
jgi:hypothetical protein